MKNISVRALLRDCLTPLRSGISIAMLTCLSLIQLGCDSRIDGGKYLYMPASSLQDVRRAWIKAGRSEDFEPSGVVSGSCSKVFFFTNNIQAEGKTYQCLFGVSDGVWPPGTLAITEDGKEIWIRERDGMAVLDPRKKLFQP